MSEQRRFSRGIPPHTTTSGKSVTFAASTRSTPFGHFDVGDNEGGGGDATPASANSNVDEYLDPPPPLMTVAEDAGATAPREGLAGYFFGSGFAPRPETGSHAGSNATNKYVPPGRGGAGGWLRQAAAAQQKLADDAARHGAAVPPHLASLYYRAGTVDTHGSVASSSPSEAAVLPNDAAAKMGFDPSRAPTSFGDAAAHVVGGGSRGDTVGVPRAQIAGTTSSRPGTARTATQGKTASAAIVRGAPAGSAAQSGAAQSGAARAAPSVGVSKAPGAVPKPTAGSSTSGRVPVVAASLRHATTAPPTRTQRPPPTTTNLVVKTGARSTAAGAPASAAGASTATSRARAVSSARRGTVTAAAGMTSAASSLGALPDASKRPADLPVAEGPDRSTAHHTERTDTVQVVPREAEAAEDASPGPPPHDSSDGDDDDTETQPPSATAGAGPVGGAAAVTDNQLGASTIENLRGATSRFRHPQGRAASLGASAAKNTAAGGASGGVVPGRSTPFAVLEAIELAVRVERVVMPLPGEPAPLPTRTLIAPGDAAVSLAMTSIRIPTAHAPVPLAGTALTARATALRGGAIDQLLQPSGRSGAGVSGNDGHDDEGRRPNTAAAVTGGGARLGSTNDADGVAAAAAAAAGSAPLLPPRTVGRYRHGSGGFDDADASDADEGHSDSHAREGGAAVAGQRFQTSLLDAAEAHAASAAASRDAIFAHAELQLAYRQIEVYEDVLLTRTMRVITANSHAMVMRPDAVAAAHRARLAATRVATPHALLAALAADAVVDLTPGAICTSLFTSDGVRLVVFRDTGWVQLLDAQNGSSALLCMPLRVVGGSPAFLQAVGASSPPDHVVGAAAMDVFVRCARRCLRTPPAVVSPNMRLSLGLSLSQGATRQRHVDGGAPTNAAGGHGSSIWSYSAQHRTAENAVTPSVGLLGFGVDWLSKLPTASDFAPTNEGQQNQRLTLRRTSNSAIDFIDGDITTTHLKLKHSAVRTQPDQRYLVAETFAPRVVTAARTFVVEVAAAAEALARGGASWMQPTEVRADSNSPVARAMGQLCQSIDALAPVPAQLPRPVGPSFVPPSVALLRAFALILDGFTEVLLPYLLVPVRSARVSPTEAEARRQDDLLRERVASGLAPLFVRVASAFTAAFNRHDRVFASAAAMAVTGRTASVAAAVTAAERVFAQAAAAAAVVAAPSKAQQQQAPQARGGPAVAKRGPSSAGIGKQQPQGTVDPLWSPTRRATGMPSAKDLLEAAGREEERSASNGTGTSDVAAAADESDLNVKPSDEELQAAAEAWACEAVPALQRATAASAARSTEALGAAGAFVLLSLLSPPSHYPSVEPLIAACMELGVEGKDVDGTDADPSVAAALQVAARLSQVVVRWFSHPVCRCGDAGDVAACGPGLARDIVASAFDLYSGEADVTAAPWRGAGALLRLSVALVDEAASIHAAVAIDAARRHLRAPYVALDPDGAATFSAAAASDRAAHRANAAIDQYLPTAVDALLEAAGICTSVSLICRVTAEETAARTAHLAMVAAARSHQRRIEDVRRNARAERDQAALRRRVAVQTALDGKLTQSSIAASGHTAVPASGASFEAAAPTGVPSLEHDAANFVEDATASEVAATAEAEDLQLRALDHRHRTELVEMAAAEEDARHIRRLRDRSLAAPLGCATAIARRTAGWADLLRSAAAATRAAHGSSYAPSAAAKNNRRPSTSDTDGVDEDNQQLSLIGGSFNASAFQRMQMIRGPREPMQPPPTDCDALQWAASVVDGATARLAPLLVSLAHHLAADAALQVASEASSAAAAAAGQHGHGTAASNTRAQGEAVTALSLRLAAGSFPRAVWAEVSRLCLHRRPELAATSVAFGYTCHLFALADSAAASLAAAGAGASSADGPAVVMFPGGARLAAGALIADIAGGAHAILNSFATACTANADSGGARAWLDATASVRCFHGLVSTCLRLGPPRDDNNRDGTSKMLHRTRSVPLVDEITGAAPKHASASCLLDASALLMELLHSPTAPQDTSRRLGTTSVTHTDITPADAYLSADLWDTDAQFFHPGRVRFPAATAASVAAIVTADAAAATRVHSFCPPQWAAAATRPPTAPAHIASHDAVAGFAHLATVAPASALGDGSFGSSGPAADVAPLPSLDFVDGFDPPVPDAVAREPLTLIDARIRAAARQIDLLHRVAPARMSDTNAMTPGASKAQQLARGASQVEVLTAGARYSALSHILHTRRLPTELQDPDAWDWASISDSHTLRGGAAAAAVVESNSIDTWAVAAAVCEGGWRAAAFALCRPRVAHAIADTLTVAPDVAALRRARRRAMTPIQRLPMRGHVVDESTTLHLPLSLKATNGAAGSFQPTLRASSQSAAGSESGIRNFATQQSRSAASPASSPQQVSSVKSAPTQSRRRRPGDGSLLASLTGTSDM